MQVVDPFYREVGRLIQARRTSRGWTQQQLGAQLQPPVTRASIANLEGGGQRVLLHTFVQMAEILECELKELMPSRSGKTSIPGRFETELERHEVPEQAKDRIRQQLMMASEGAEK